MLNNSPQKCKKYQNRTSGQEKNHSLPVFENYVPLRRSKWLVMKRFLFVFVALFFVCQAVAQTGQSYTLQSLTQYLPNAVQSTQPNQYRILQNLTLLAEDTLVLESSAVSVSVDHDVTLTFLGTVLTENRDQMLLIQGDSTQNNYFEIRFEDAAPSILSKAHIQYCSHITLINSNILIDDCELDHFSGHVISYMNCNPVIQNSYIHDNQACAIQSAVNADGCPSILNNVFYNNVLGNANTPQINIGPGTTDTIRIIGNTIEGVASNMSGGIGIMNLNNPNVSKVLLKDNIIKNNRYGYTQNGYLISSDIFDNQFIDNNLEVNPNNGGSGISIYGYDNTCAAKLRRNLITGNLWGVTAIYYHHVDMGTTDEPGYNLLYNNGNGGVDYELYNNAFSDMDAVGNYWGCDNADAAEAVIYHQADDASLGLVNYLPIYVLEPEGISSTVLTKINLAPNPVSQGYFTLENPTEEVLQWQIFTSAGQCVMNGKAQLGTTRIATNTLKPGVYLVYIQKDNTFIAKKLIVR